MRPGRPLSRRLQEEEHGAVLVLVTVILAVMIMMVALVIDISALRGDRRDSSKTADMASMAGVLDLLPASGGDPELACQQSWAYLVINTPDIPNGEVANDGFCGNLGGYENFTLASCPTSAIEATTTTGPYGVTITWPVPDDHPAMGDQAIDGDVDGHPCERLAVWLNRDREFGFAQVGGFTGATTGAPAVGRATVGGATPETVALVVLDPHGTRALCAAGKGGVWVKSVEIAGETHPGMISVDSDESVTGDCDGEVGDYAIYVQGNAGARIQAGGDTFGEGNATDGHIFSYALQIGEDGYDQLQVPEKLEPEPEPGRQITRQFIDDRYLDEITALRSFVGSAGAPDASFQQYTAAGHPCTVDADLTLGSGNWWIDCPGGLTVQSGNPAPVLTIPDGNVVVDGPVTVKGGLVANQGSDRWFYIRGGDFEKAAGATIRLGSRSNQKGTFVYLHDGVLTFAGNDDGALNWFAPFQPGTDGRDFEDLALWSESSPLHFLQGQADLDIEGTFFTPNADPFRFAGRGGQNQTSAQFVTHRLEAAGQGTLVMEPDPSRSTPPPILRVTLIR